MPVIYSERTCSDYWSRASLWGFTKSFYKWETWASGVEPLAQVLEPGLHAGERSSGHPTPPPGLNHSTMPGTPCHFWASSELSWLNHFRLFVGQNNCHAQQIPIKWAHALLKISYVQNRECIIPLVFQTSGKSIHHWLHLFRTNYAHSKHQHHTLVT